MQQIRKRLTYANVMSSIAVFLVLGGATAIAATKLGTGRIKAGAITAAKLHKNAVRTGKVKNNAITGPKVNESTLGTVPSATTASNLVGQTPFYIRLAFGQSQVIATNGVVSLTAVCDQSGGNDRARILMATTQDGAVANGQTADFSGNAGNFLNVATPEAQREFLTTQIPTGQTSVSYNIDEGFVLGPDNKMLTTNSEGVALGLNFGGSNCIFGGIVNAVG